MSHRINFSQLIYFDQIPSLQGRSFDPKKADMGPPKSSRTLTSLTTADTKGLITKHCWVNNPGE
jgi:hypothetical protein